MKEFIELWQNLAKQNGLKGIHFIGHTYNLAKDRIELMRMGFDAINVVRLFDFEKKARRHSNGLFSIWIITFFTCFSKYLGSAWFKTKALPRERGE